MKPFFELSAKEQIEKIMGAIEENKSKRTPLVRAVEITADPFADLFWKQKEIDENSNPIAVPVNTRFRLAKRIVGKLIRTYTRQQVHFNLSVTMFSNLLIKHLKDMNARFDQLEKAVVETNGLNETTFERVDKFYEKLKTEVDLIRTEKSTLEKQLNEINNMHSVAAQNKTELEKLKKELNEQIEQIQNVRAWVSGIERGEKGLENWLKLIDERVSDVESFQHRTRKEIFAELKHNVSNTDVRNQLSKINAQIMNPQKIEFFQHKGYMKVNLGCGAFIKEDYINIDMRPLEGVDIIADVREVPLQLGTIDELYLSHVIEHFPEVEMQNYILPYWKSLLSPGGKIRIICPNWEAMLEGYSKGEISYDILKEITFGSQEYDGNQHYNMFTPKSLIELMESIGFKNIVTVESNRKNGLCLEMEIEGVR